MRDFYNHDKVKVTYDVDAGDIKEELKNGNVVIVPANGRLLNNPFYTPPGPLYHMLLVKGFDDSNQEFITNDPGTNRGESYRYKYEVLENAMADYPTGKHKPRLRTRKAMIVVER